MKFEDHFSAQSKKYAQFRPQYPDSLYEYFASIVPVHSLAWDCGTGNGQAAIGLTQHFERVYATDAGVDQVSQAYPHPKVEYHVESAEGVGLESESVDLVTVAQAVHWFNFDKFYAEVNRVLKPGGVLAVWTYSHALISPHTDKAMERLYSEVLAGFWPERIRYIEEKYRTLPFPFDEIDTPSFEMETRWNLGQLTGYLDSWSAAKKYREQKGTHPIKEVWDELSYDWEDERKERVIRWPLYFRIGRRT